MQYRQTQTFLALVGPLALRLLVGCGSGGTTMSNGGTTVTASFTGTVMPTAVAYQAGATGTFQPLDLSGSSTSFTLPSGVTSYEFAYMCPVFDPTPPSTYTSADESVVQATTSDTTSLSFSCPSTGGNVSVTYDYSAIPGASLVYLITATSSEQVIGPPKGNASVSGVPIGTSDIALVVASATRAIAIQIQRGVNVTSSTPTIAFPPMTAANMLGTAPVTLQNIPPLASSGGFYTADIYNTYNTPSGLSIPLFRLFDQSEESGQSVQSTYPTVPASQAQPGDFYVLQGGGEVTTPDTQLVSVNVSTTSPAAVSLPLPTPSNSLTAPAAAAFPTFNANLSGFTATGTIVNSSVIEYQPLRGGTETFYVYTYVTKSWLGTNTTFTVPDLSSVKGFNPAPASGVRENWLLSSSMGTPLAFPSAIGSFASPTSLQTLETFGAFTVP